jgi:NAD+ kinase
MKSKFRHIALLGKYNLHLGSGAKPSSRQTLESIAQFLHTQGCEVILEHDTASGSGLNGYPVMGIEEIGKTCDLAIVVGGDGTMLGYARQLAPHKVPMIGINQGRLGFITDIPLSEVERTLEAMLGGAYEEDNRALMRAKVWRDGHCVSNALALNDVVVNKGAASRLVELQVHVDGQFVFDLRADGLIIATPTGSTAYALSSNGPIMHPDLRGLVLVPISPHTLSNRPIALSDRAVLDITLVRAADARLHFDGQPQYDLIEGDRVVVQKATHAITFVHPPGYSYYAMLREKLHWSESL